jgi:AcrR family transcriptional regulator
MSTNLRYPSVPCQDPPELPARRRILNAAFETFAERGYADTSTLEIATRARVSKREVYSLVGNKQATLIACIGARSERLRMPTDVPAPRNRATLRDFLSAFGANLLLTVSDPKTVGMFRLAIAEAERTPEIAQALDSLGRETSRAALRQIMTHAQTAGLLAGEPAELVEHFMALLWGNVMMNLLLGLTEAPNSDEARRRADKATGAFLSLHSTGAKPR